MIDGRFPEFGLKIVTQLLTARSADSIRCVGVSRSFLGVFFHYGLLWPSALYESIIILQYLPLQTVVGAAKATYQGEEKSGH